MPRGEKEENLRGDRHAWGTRIQGRYTSVVVEKGVAGTPRCGRICKTDQN